MRGRNGSALGRRQRSIARFVVWSNPIQGRSKAGDRVVIPFNISCGDCWMCSRKFFAQCETTQNRETEKGAYEMFQKKEDGAIKVVLKP